MKSSHTKVSLALLSAVFIFGCQDMGAGPDGLDPQLDKAVNGVHNHGGDDEPDPLSSLDLADGMIAMGLPVGVGKETNKTLKIGNNNQVREPITMAFTDNTCVGAVTTKSGTVPVRDTDGVFEKLLEQLTKVVPGGQLLMEIDKPGLELDGATTSGRHSLRVDYEDEVNLELGHILIGFGGPHDDVPPATVAWTLVGNEDVYTFDGWMSVWANFGRGNQSQVIKCPDQQVVVTLHR